MSTRNTSVVLAFAVGFALANQPGCSTLAPVPVPRTCQSDADCDQNKSEICALDQGICYEATLPPRRTIAIRVREPCPAGAACEFVYEAKDCDAHLALDPTLDSAFNLRRRQVQDVFHMTIRSLVPGLVAAVPLAANLSVRQESRLGEAPLLLSTTFPQETQTNGSAVVAWPYHHPDDDDASERLRTLVLQIDPVESPGPDDDGDPNTPPPLLDEHAMVWHPLFLEREVERECNSDSDCDVCAADGTCCPAGQSGCNLACDHRPDAPNVCSLEASAHDFIIDVRDECDRRLTGTVMLVSGDEQTGYVASPAEKAAVRLSYAEPVGAGATHNECDSHADCAPGLGCNTERKLCGLDLTGLPVANGEAKTNDQGTFTSRVYTYCDGPEFLSRQMRVTVTPAEDTIPSAGSSRAPRVTYTFQQQFISFDPRAGPVPDLEPEVEAPLCIPYWQPADVTIRMGGAPVELLNEADQRWTCCDTSCLSSPVPGAAPETCASDPVFRVTLQGSAPLPEGWTEIDCMDAMDGEARFSTQAQCSEATCEARLGSASPNAPTTYLLRLETPTSSVFRSRVISYAIYEGHSEVTVQLEPRALIRGVVRLPSELCDHDGSTGRTCTPQGSTVMAERIAMPDETAADVPGPYFFQTITRGQGGFVLPVNPGVYVVTAVPAAGTPGGPSRYVVLDLRDEALAASGGAYELADALVLEPGVLASVRLREFERTSSVAAIDVGSWAFDPDDPGATRPLRDPNGRALDLNAPETCLRAPEDGPRGCSIRRITLGDLLLTLESTVQFAVRNQGSTSCTPPS